MTPAPYPLGMIHPEMSAPTLALYLRRIQDTRSVAALNTLADEIERAYPPTKPRPGSLASLP